MRPRILLATYCIRSMAYVRATFEPSCINPTRATLEINRTRLPTTKPQMQNDKLTSWTPTRDVDTVTQRAEAGDVAIGGSGANRRGESVKVAGVTNRWPMMSKRKGSQRSACSGVVLQQCMRANPLKTNP
jgi:hypothetical protein